MARNRASAKKAGTAFETLVTDYLASALDDDRIERRAKNGAKDRGDIGGVRCIAGRVVVETKDYGGRQCRTCHNLRKKARRRGMTLADFAVLLGGNRE